MVPKELSAFPLSNKAGARARNQGARVVNVPSDVEQETLVGHVGRGQSSSLGGRVNNQEVGMLLLTCKTSVLSARWAWSLTALAPSGEPRWSATYELVQALGRSKSAKTSKPIHISATLNQS